ncbi:S41 family peptidase [Candidatus Peregrinibacteria bacterium]|nr:S41 family peptidase [Candidatus Peregrinibacteria bacterium]
MNSKKSLVVGILALSIFTFTLGWISAQSYDPTKLSEVEVSPDPLQRPLGVRDLDEVWARLRGNYYDAKKLAQDKLEYGAVKGFVGGIGDPYTVFMTPEESKEFGNDLNGQLEGIGAQLEVKNGKLVVVTPLKGSPAEEVGIKAGDVIYKIDGALSQEMTLYQAVSKIRGAKNTQVKLIIIRENVPKPLEFTITRREITIDTITLKKLDGDIYHLAIHQFNDHTNSEFQNAIQKILLDKSKGLIVDVRGNGGGYLETSVEIISEFISGQKTAVIIKRRDVTKNETIKTGGSAKLADIPMVVLVDKGSASASEILAGAIQDYKRGILIGEKTFGKGSVQEISDLADGASLRMTIAKWFTPLDRTIDETGITPDQEVPFTDKDAAAGKDPQLDAAVEYLRNR